MFQDSTALNYHLDPFKLFSAGPGGFSQRIYSEVFNLDTMNEEYEALCAKVQAKKSSQMEVVIVAIILWLDLNQLVQFGSASLWPIYIFFGNQSKYK